VLDKPIQLKHILFSRCSSTNRFQTPHAYKYPFLQEDDYREEAAHHYVPMIQVLTQKPFCIPKSENLKSRSKLRLRSLNSCGFQHIFLTIFSTIHKQTMLPNKTDHTIYLRNSMKSTSFYRKLTVFKLKQNFLLSAFLSNK